MTASRILICDGHEIVREGLRARIGEVPGFEVVGEAADGRQAIALAIRYSFLTPADAPVPKLRSPGGTPVNSR